MNQLAILLSFILFFAFCHRKINDFNSTSLIKTSTENPILPGSYNLAKYISKIYGKRVGIVVHPCSMIENTTLLDTLVKLKVDIRKVFVPEHGFRGSADAGEKLDDSIDTLTGIPIISLYGKNKKPSADHLKDLDVILFDLQDVGVRFYTYSSTLLYLMEACSENGVGLIVLDRPNPNGFYVDGPVLQDSFKSFIGLMPIPIVYGLTLGELALMIKGEAWIKNSNSLNLNIIPCINYDHNSHYIIPIKPSPNLPNELSILLYPSICLFEGTVVSLGRGTTAPFQIYGHPDLNKFDTTFIPTSIIGAKSPPLMGRLCKGYSLRNVPPEKMYKEMKINLSYLLKMSQELKYNDSFFLKNNFIDKLTGTSNFRNQVLNHWSEQEIRNSWKKDLIEYKKKRKQYLLYNDFEN